MIGATVTVDDPGVYHLSAEFLGSAPIVESSAAAYIVRVRGRTRKKLPFSMVIRKLILGSTFTYQYIGIEHVDQETTFELHYDNVEAERQLFTVLRIK